MTDETAEELCDLDNHPAQYCECTMAQAVAAERVRFEKIVREAPHIEAGLSAAITGEAKKEGDAE